MSEFVPVLVAELPAAKGRSAARDPRRAAAMKLAQENPGWWVFAEQQNNTGYAVNYKRRGFETTTRAVGEGLINIYVMMPVKTDG